MWASISFFTFRQAIKPRSAVSGLSAEGSGISAVNKIPPNKIRTDHCDLTTLAASLPLGIQLPEPASSLQCETNISALPRLVALARRVYPPQPRASPSYRRTLIRRTPAGG